MQIEKRLSPALRLSSIEEMGFDVSKRNKRGSEGDNAKRPQTRLFLVMPPMGTPLALVELAQVLAAGDVASLLIAEKAVEGKAFATYARPLIEAAQSAGAAALLCGDSRMVARLGADGLHCDGESEELRLAIDTLAPAYIVGAGAIHSRHEAMQAGEAEVDYVFFGQLMGEAGNELDLLSERAQWWQEVFVIPSVVFARDLASVAQLARAGADFIALGAALWQAPQGPVAAIKAAQSAIETVFAELAS